MNDQYRIIEGGAGYVEFPHRGRLRVRGGDALTFLQGLVTNDVVRLDPGQGCYTTLLNAQGRMLAEFDVLRRSDGLFLSLSAGQMPALAHRLDGLVFAEDVEVIDEGPVWSELAVFGAESAGRLAAALDLPSEGLVALADLSQLDLPSGFVSRATDVALPMYRVFTAASERDNTISNVERAGVRAVSTELFEALRVDHGRPVWGADLGPDVIPLEAGLLERAISTSKGCYVGQEIVIRILHRGGGRVARRLVRLAFDGRPTPGAALVASDGTSVGRVTSVADAAGDNRVIGLGYVGRDHAATGTALGLADGRGTAFVSGPAG